MFKRDYALADAYTIGLILLFLPLISFIFLFCHTPLSAFGNDNRDYISVVDPNNRYDNPDNFIVYIDSNKYDDPNYIPYKLKTLLENGISGYFGKYSKTEEKYKKGFLFCFKCHYYMYPDKAYDANSPDAPICEPEYNTVHENLCFKDSGGRFYPIEYSSSDDPNGHPTGRSEAFHTEFTRKKFGHQSHIVFQPFGLGRDCLDCHDENLYCHDPNLAYNDPDVYCTDPNMCKASKTYGHNTGKRVYLREGSTLQDTNVCTECHGGFYPYGSEESNVSQTVKVLRWGEPHSVTCLQCHDNSPENGGAFGKYQSRFTTERTAYSRKRLDGIFDLTGRVITNITAPDPDKISGQNNWSKNGHGIYADSYYAGVTIDTTYPYNNKPNSIVNIDPVDANVYINPVYPYINKLPVTYPNRGAMNSPDVTENLYNHDITLDQDDNVKNFCFECHWDPRTTKGVFSASSDPDGYIPDHKLLGKYNGHTNLKEFKDERWENKFKNIPAPPHFEWTECRVCHRMKFSHIIGDKSQGQPTYCVECHNPHGSANNNGKANLFMIKGEFQEYTCKNCHIDEDIDEKWIKPFQVIFNEYIQYADNTFEIKLDAKDDPGVIIPYNSTDICEACHIKIFCDPNNSDFDPLNPLDQWGEHNPNYSEHLNNPNIPDYVERMHVNGAGHFFGYDANSNIKYIDYRGTDCTGCHPHDPDPIPESLAAFEALDADKNSQILADPFNTKAFAPTCRCHGIGRIDIGTLAPLAYLGEGNIPDFAGKGHGTPPPPFPDGTVGYDPHMAHAVYGFPCIRCHIDPESPFDVRDPSFDPSEDYYFFKIDGNTPVGFDQFLNPNGYAIPDIYDPEKISCNELYCHSNGKGYYKTIGWMEADRFNRTLIDQNTGHPQYCNKCHNTPPGPDGTNHSGCPDSVNCKACHPHNGLYKESVEPNNFSYDLNGVINPYFFKHVNGRVEAGNITESFGTNGCGCCHNPSDPNLAFHSPERFPEGSCSGCHKIKEDFAGEGFRESHKDFLFSDANSQSEKDSFCANCHGNGPYADANSRIINKPLYDTGCYSNRIWVHKASNNCTVCHKTVIDTLITPNQSHIQDPNTSIAQTWSEAVPNSCGVCHGTSPLREIHQNIPDDKKCSECHGTHCLSMQGEKIEMEKKCTWCHNDSYFSDLDLECGPVSNPNLAHNTRIPGDPLNTTLPCFNCHQIYNRDGVNYSLKDYHFQPDSSAITMTGAWDGSSISNLNRTDCGLCHVDTQARQMHMNIDPATYPCQSCHGEHCDMEMMMDQGSWSNGHFGGLCGGCHLNDIQICDPTNPLSPCLPGQSQYLHAQIPPGVSCSECHQDHSGKIAGWLSDAKFCNYCHTPPIRVKGCIDSPLWGHVPDKDCQFCHPGVYMKEKHYLDAGNTDLFPSFQLRPNSCGRCHTDLPPVPGSGRYPTIHSALPLQGDLNCAACHGKHCDMIFGVGPTPLNVDQKCIACHGPNPLIKDICNIGIPVDTPHTTLFSDAINASLISDCVSCHYESQSGGETNPINHIDDPMTYVNPGTCLKCHPEPNGKTIFNKAFGVPPVLTFHGMSGLPWQGGIWPNVNCYSCHPDHCKTIFSDNQACIWCHTTNPIINDICKIGLPVNTPHTTVFSDPINALMITDCMSCHFEPVTGGETNPKNHKDDPMTYVNPGTCLKCHPEPNGRTVFNLSYGIPPTLTMHGSSGVPWQGGIWPNVNCYSCHPDHCKTTYYVNQACIWCHSINPPISVCDPFSMQPHNGNCLGCHTDGPMIGEGNPLDHNNKTPFISPISCPSCHESIKITHKPGTENCSKCHLLFHNNQNICYLEYCSENICKICHNEQRFDIFSDYGCENFDNCLNRIMPVEHEVGAYTQCNRCHIGECKPSEHKISPSDAGNFTDLRGMRLDFADCSLCHMNAREIHAGCSQGCQFCHAGTSNHLCNLNNMKLMNTTNDFQYCECCHPGAQKIHENCTQPCTFCHSGSTKHLCNFNNMQADKATCSCCHPEILTTHANCDAPCSYCHFNTTQSTTHFAGIDYCDQAKCRCCHIDPGINSVCTPYADPLNLIGAHTANAFNDDCVRCHIDECNPLNHKNQPTLVTGMSISGFTDCALCHVNAQILHNGCTSPCTLCHENPDVSYPEMRHLCKLDFCTDERCVCCHTPAKLLYHGTTLNPSCSCIKCHTDECAPIEHYNSLFPLNPAGYNYAPGTATPLTGCNCCHAAPPQAVCIGTTVYDHCLDYDPVSLTGCDPDIFNCGICHVQSTNLPFDGTPGHIRQTYGLPGVTSCLCHAPPTNTVHIKHLETNVMTPVYPTGSNYVIDCKACHFSVPPVHVEICLNGTTFTTPVQFDASLPMIGLVDEYLPGLVPGSGQCYLYCHSDGDIAPLDTPVATYLFYDPALLISVPDLLPAWNQSTANFVSCGNTVIGFTPNAMYQCHGYPPPVGHPGGGAGGGGGGGGALNCTNCHPTPFVDPVILPGVLPDILDHINGIKDLTIGGPGPGVGGAGPFIPVI